MFYGPTLSDNAKLTLHSYLEKNNLLKAGVEYVLEIDCNHQAIVISVKAGYPDRKIATGIGLYYFLEPLPVPNAKLEKGPLGLWYEVYSYRKKAFAAFGGQLDPSDGWY